MCTAPLSTWQVPIVYSDEIEAEQLQTLRKQSSCGGPGKPCLLPSSAFKVQRRYFAKADLGRPARHADLEPPDQAPRHAYAPFGLPQHRPLASLGPPYVYNFDIRNESSLVAAAEQAVRLRFASFVPWAHRLETAVAAVCANLMQHDALCVCAAQPRNPAFPCTGTMQTVYT